MTPAERAAKVAEITDLYRDEVTAKGVHWTWNFTHREIVKDVAALLAIVAELERENADLRSWSSEIRDPMAG